MTGKGLTEHSMQRRDREQTHDLASRAGAKRGTGSQKQEEGRRAIKGQSLKTICWP